MGKTSIEWTDCAWPIVTGCTRVSEGCRHCYSERLTATRLKNVPAYKGLATMKHGDPRWTGEIRLNKKVLEDPLHWKKPRRIFVSQMSDLFHEAIPDEFILDIVRVMAAAHWHTYQILTKRPERMHALLVGWYEKSIALPNLWLGVSCEDQPTADERIPLLLQTPAAVRFVSVEPMLGPIDLQISAFNGADSILFLSCQSLEGLHWVIVGGESGPGARPMQEEWARSVMQQCKAGGVPFFMKQGSKANWPDFKNFESFPKDLQIREFPRGAPPCLAA